MIARRASLAEQLLRNLCVPIIVALAGCALQSADTEPTDGGAMSTDTSPSATVAAEPQWLCFGKRPHCPEPYCSSEAMNAWLAACWSDGVARPEPPPGEVVIGDTP